MSDWTDLATLAERVLEGTERVPPSAAERLARGVVAMQAELAVDSARSSLAALLDAVDYTSGACRPTEPVAAALPTALVQHARRALSGGGLRPMSQAPKTGPVVEILAAVRRAGCRGWLIVHHADGGGEEQPRFRGWFYWTGYGFNQLDDADLIGWLPMPRVPGAIR